MKNVIYYSLLPLLLLSCNKVDKIYGPIAVPDALFNYTAEGEGIPCVIFTGSENIGHKLFPEKLRETFLFIHADPGKIDPSMVSDISMADVIDDIEKLRQSLRIDKIAVMGHSMFGVLPFEYAVRYPNNISYLISTGSFPYHNEKFISASNDYWELEASDQRKTIRANNLAELQQVDMNNLSQSQQFIKLYTAETPFRFYDPHFDMTELWDGVEINMDFLGHFGGNLIKNFDNSDNYKKIQAPTLVITGKYDFGCPYYLWEDFKESIPNLSLIVYGKAGHNPMLEIPDVFTEDVLEWIRKSELL